LQEKGSTAIVVHVFVELEEFVNPLSVVTIIAMKAVEPYELRAMLQLPNQINSFLAWLGRTCTARNLNKLSRTCKYVFTASDFFKSCCCIGSNMNSLGLVMSHLIVDVAPVFWQFVKPLNEKPI